MDVRGLMSLLARCLVDPPSILDSWIRPFHDLLTISIGRPVRLTELRLRPADAGPRAPLCAARFGVVQAQGESKSVTTGAAQVQRTNACHPPERRGAARRAADSLGMSCGCESGRRSCICWPRSTHHSCMASTSLGLHVRQLKHCTISHGSPAARWTGVHTRSVSPRCSPGSPARCCLLPRVAMTWTGAPLRVQRSSTRSSNSALPPNRCQEAGDPFGEVTGSGGIAPHVERLVLAERVTIALADLAAAVRDGLVESDAEGGRRWL